jgi:hypothetical protein
MDLEHIPASPHPEMPWPMARAGLAFFFAEPAERDLKGLPRRTVRF